MTDRQIVQSVRTDLKERPIVDEEVIERQRHDQRAELEPEPSFRAGLAAGVGLGATIAAAAGAVSAGGLSAPKARLALMVALGTGSAGGVRQWFSEL